MSVPRILAALCASLALALALAPDALRGEERPSLVLITLDTTRADYVGRVDAGEPLTPNLDALARGGTRYADAITPAPLTLPAHCSLLTGLDPPAHGVRDNGISSLSAQPPTLAGSLFAHGYVTGAFVSSRVLDRRFGLNRGFATYDDRMIAEQMGEQGYPERDARAVTDAALAWAVTLPRERPFFLWIHYYDPHAPYRPPGDWQGQPSERRYAGEVAYVDTQVGRLLRGLPQTAAGRLVAVVGDHGEMLGEHGESEHGILLYRASLSVPLILSGPGVPAQAEVRELVATRALASTILQLLGWRDDARLFGSALPGLGLAAAKAPKSVYSETLLPANTYGWSPLQSVTEARWRYVEGPRGRLFDRRADPGETRDVSAQFPKEAARLRGVLQAEYEDTVIRPSGSAPADPELSASLRSLGYLSGASPAGPKGLDPHDGVRLLQEFDEAKQWLNEGKTEDAVARLESLVRRNPGNVPFLLRLGDAQMSARLSEEGLRSLTRAVELSPRLDFVRVRLAQAYAEVGQPDLAIREYRATLSLNPRNAPAWSGLAEVYRRREGPLSERKILEECEAAGTASATLLKRLSDLEIALGDVEAGRAHAAEAARRAEQAPAPSPGRR